MNRQNLLRITLLVSVLAFNPVVAQTLRTDLASALTKDAQQKRAVASELAAALEAKGLEADAAEKIGSRFVDNQHEALEAMLYHVEILGGMEREKLVAYLGDEALFRRTVDLASYDSLVSMATKIHGATPDAALRSRLKIAADENARFVSAV